MGDWIVCGLEAGEAGAAGDMLGRAFSENPVARACLPHCDAASRERRVTRLNRALIEGARRAGTVEIVREGSAIVAAQLSFAPGQWPLGVRDYPWLIAGAASTGLRGALRYAMFDHTVGPHHPKVPHFYLFVLGVEPRAQGRGAGSALLRRFCARADAAGVPAYLETDKRETVRLYERHGFEVEREVTSDALGGLRAWLMHRRPR